MTRPIESTESSSPIITRAVAAGLLGRTVENYEFPAWQRQVLLALGALPQGAARFAISRFQSFSGLPPESLDHFSLDDLIGTRLEDYAGLKGQFPAVTLGAGLGGATSYLSLALGGPFLPQAFVITLQQGSYRGDADEYLHRSLDAALRIAAHDPRLMTIQHYDPVHDGWLTRFVNHLRFKLVTLPEQYAEFIRQRVEPGGAVVYLEGGAAWQRYRLGERSVFQVGGWGDLSAEEFLQGSPRLTAYAKRTGLTTDHWSLSSPRWPLETGPESEWGSEPGLAEALERFCRDEGFRFVRLHGRHPNDFSRLAFSAAKRLLKKEGREPAGTLVECFSQFDSASALQSGLLPLWLIFNTLDSARYLKEMSTHFPKEKPVFFSPLVTFSLTPDMASWQEWIAALGRDFINIGTRSSHYPADARALVRWAEPLRAWVRANTRPIQTRLTAEELAGLL
jgi:hypothetical protein